MEGVSETSDELCALRVVQSGRWIRGKNKIAVQIDNEGIARSSEECAALGGDTEDVWARFLNKLFGVTSMDNRNVETTPLVDTNAISYGLGSNGEHRWVVRDKDDAASLRYSSFDNSDNVWNGQAAEQWPHGKVLEASG